MGTRKIKVFLGAYVNSTNAQNLNCLSIAKHIDKNAFIVKTMTLFSGNLKIQKLEGVTYIRVRKPHRIFRYWAYLKGIYWCDIAYLPKGEISGYTAFLIKVFNKKSMNTVEGILNDENLNSSIELAGSSTKLFQSLKTFDKLYSITEFLKKYNLARHHIVTEDKVLYLGSEIDTFLNEDKSISKLVNIICIGRLLKRKGIYDVLELAKTFPNLNFHIVGHGTEEEHLKRIIKVEALSNFKLVGVLDHASLSRYLKNMDLHVFPSRSEGFPKVTLETAAAGVPSLVYGDYGANEWMTHNQNGFVVDTLKEMSSTIQMLIETPELLRSNSKNAIALAKQFDWHTIIKTWETEFLKLYNN